MCKQRGKLVGDRFGLLFVEEEFGTDPDRGALWVCRCDCGNTLIRSTRELRRAKLAACLRCNSQRKSMQFTTHGQSRVEAGRPSPLYKVWGSMHERCSNPKHPYFKNYGGKGVGVCQEWSSFLKFSEWAIANGYTYFAELDLGDRLSLDREDPDGDYCPKNCRWIPHRDNCRRLAFGQEV